VKIWHIYVGAGQPDDGKLAVGSEQFVKLADYDALAADLAAIGRHSVKEQDRIRALEAALRNLNDTVKSMRNPQTLADVGLLLLKFNGPVFVADQLLGSQTETKGKQG
jgi:hypothetical protein